MNLQSISRLYFWTLPLVALLFIMTSTRIEWSGQEWYVLPPLSAISEMPDGLRLPAPKWQIFLLIFLGFLPWLISLITLSLFRKRKNNLYMSFSPIHWVFAILGFLFLIFMNTILLEGRLIFIADLSQNLEGDKVPINSHFSDTITNFGFVCVGLAMLTFGIDIFKNFKAA